MWMTALVVLATVLAVATPIKIWNSARIEHRLQEQEKLLLAAKIEALKSQINPHFLFNTLASISSLIRSEPETARTLIIKLSGLLRRLIRSHQHFVTLREELEAIDEYLDIEVVRFGPKLGVRKEISPDTIELVVPSMILQPLVENSIKHGLARKLGPGSIVIRSWREHGRAVLEVEDDGMGFLLDRLEEPMSSGIGLANVRERLRVIYGATSQFTLTSEPGRGTRVRIEIPELVGRRPDHRMTMADYESRNPNPEAQIAGPKPRIDIDVSTPLKVMVVDDEQPARDELCYQLEQLGDVEVVAQAGNGVEALAAVDRFEPDLIFLDIQMPGLNGFEVARRLLDRQDYVTGTRVRHRVRSARRRGIRGQRGRLPSEAGRPGPPGTGAVPGPATAEPRNGRTRSTTSSSGS